MMFTLLYLALIFIIYSYYGYVWAKAAGKDKAKILFGITGFLITLATHWLLAFLVHYAFGYAIDDYYSNAFIQRYFLQILTSITLISLILVSELYDFLLRRRLGKISVEIEQIGHQNE